MRVRIPVAALAGVAALAVLAPAASAMDTTPVLDAKEPSKVTVSSYRAYLKAKGKDGKVTLADFNGLTAAKQKKFVTYLSDATIYKAFKGKLNGTPKERKKGKLTRYNKDVAFQFSVTRAGAAGGTKKKPAFKATFTGMYRIYGIPVTTERVWVTYRVDNKNIDKVLASGTSGHNDNAAYTLTASKVKPSVWEGDVYAGTTWKAVPRVAAFGTKTIKKGEEIIPGAAGFWEGNLAVPRKV